MRMVAVVFLLTRQVLAQCLLSQHIPSSPVARVLLQRGSCALGWGSGRGSPSALWHRAWLAISQGTWHSLGQSPPLLLEHIRTAQPSCSRRSSVRCRVPG